MKLFNQKNHYGWLSISIHWITAITVIALFILGLWMVELTYYDDWYKQAPFIHKSIGVSLFFLTLLRLLWRKLNSVPENLSTHSAVERSAAKFVHIALYVLLFSIMLSGYLISTADGRAIDVFNLLSIPATLYDIDKQEDIAGVIHLVLAIALISLVTVHAGAAIKHHFIDKDRTLKRMFGL